jgi:hypothetical protein
MLVVVVMADNMRRTRISLKEKWEGKKLKVYRKKKGNKRKKKLLLIIINNNLT